MNRVIIQARAGALSVQFETNESVHVVTHGRAGARTDYAEMLTHCLDHPIDYPPLMSGILGGDKVAIALEDDVPDGKALAMGVVDYLCQHGVRPDHISIVIGTHRSSQVDEIIAALREAAPEIHVIVHDPKQQESHAYVAASDSADPIYVQRELIDADVTIPIYCARTTECPNASDMFGIAPNFTDAGTQLRWNMAWLEDNITHLNQHDKLSLEVGWLVGIHFAIAVVPSMSGHVAEILAGKPQPVFQKATASILNHESGAHDLVVAIVDGLQEQQTWMSVARAAAQAELLCRRDGRIVVCCDVKKLSRGIRDLAKDDIRGDANSRLLKSHVDDAFPAAILRSIRQSHSIFLFSSLTAHETESIGLAHVDSNDSLGYLVSHAQNPCVIRGAQY